ncbi:TRAP transporter substrate-binding protein [Oceanobacter sp. 4_MG-2023]|uniref:TRAP transporter substrate-binding protein n=1 Tax=Oceanobacter sp. 4_MG-2023 TaxID=3062623 RepID=UPI0027326820|nr:TRAP transporter substrate-binding protein [Oceanobacter sp. 4_MG-2023]MDP2548418.1 TRAP transporter substrate-binding protein [Oceanobacter sp. 4_MG-2023]
MKIKNLLVALGVTLGSLTTAFHAQAAEPEYTFKLHHFLPPMAMAHKKILQPWADKVMKESGGRIKIDVFPAMQLGGKPPQLLDQVRKGVVDISWTVGGYTPGRFPKASVFELPFMAASAEATSMALQEYGEEEMQDELSDVHVLALHTHAPGSLHSRGELLKTSADVKGLKLRAPNKAMAEAFDIMGAAPVFMPVTQMSSALSKGILDVAALPFEVVVPMKINQLTNNHTLVSGDRGLYTQFFVFSMNKKTYAKLPAELKKVIDNNAGIELSRHIGSLFDQSEQAGYDITAAGGNHFYTLPASEAAHWKKQMQPVTDAWINDMTDDGLNGQALYNKANALITKYLQQTGS